MLTTFSEPRIFVMPSAMVLLPDALSPTMPRRTGRVMRLNDIKLRSPHANARKNQTLQRHSHKRLTSSQFLKLVSRAQTEACFPVVGPLYLGSLILGRLKRSHLPVQTPRPAEPNPIL